jgi:hypothetical protein
MMTMRTIAGRCRWMHTEDGAVTVDWVVLCAAIIGMAMLVLMPVALGTDTLAGTIGSSIGGLRVGYAD